MSTSFLANFSPFIFIYVIYLVGFGLTHFVKLNMKFFYRIKAIFPFNGLVTIFLFTLQEQFLLIFLQFKQVNFSTSSNALSFFLSILALGHIIYMLLIYYQKIKDFSPNELVDDKFKGYFAKMFFTSYNNTICKSYNVVYVVAKFGMAISIVTAKPYTSGVMEVFFFCMFLVNDLVCTFKARQQNQVEFIQLIMQGLTDLIVMPMVLVPCIMISSTTITESQYVNFVSRAKFAAMYAQLFIIFKMLLMIAEVALLSRTVLKNFISKVFDEEAGPLNLNYNDSSNSND